MHQPTHFLIFFMSFPLFSLCFGSFHEYPLFVSQYHDLIYGHYPKPRWNTGFYGSTTRQDRVSSLSGSPKVAMILVPKGRTYYLKPITFSGPCRSPLTLKIDGIIKASPRMSDYDHDRRHWLKFEGVDNFVVEGNGIINGNGKKWWQNSCKVNKELPCRRAPTVRRYPYDLRKRVRRRLIENVHLAVTFYQCINLVVANLKLENAQQMHLTFQKCTNVQALNLRVVAPENSPNTDGIHFIHSAPHKLEHLGQKGQLFVKISTKISLKACLVSITRKPLTCFRSCPSFVEL
ncbi:hypothetical protein SDJN02_19945, partial [Cucurbita argyrosperma subsp. argyrosperma]